MWIFTSGGFVSIVENYKQPGFLLVVKKSSQESRAEESHKATRAL